jgi:hypothetical protein
MRNNRAFRKLVVTIKYRRTYNWTAALRIERKVAVLSMFPIYKTPVRNSDRLSGGIVINCNMENFITDTRIRREKWARQKPEEAML